VQRRTLLKEHELSFLLGRNPGYVARAMTLYERGVPARVPAGLPAMLLERRPDLREAEATLRSAGANIGVAKAAFFPTIKLTGELGVQSDALNGPAGIGMILGSLAAGLTAPIFQGGALTSKYKIALAQYEQSKIVYEKAVLTAFHEWPTRLVTLDRLRRYRAEQERQVGMLRVSVDLSKRRYRGGLSNYIEVLDAQQELYSVETHPRQDQGSASSPPSSSCTRRSGADSSDRVHHQDGMQLLPSLVSVLGSAFGCSPDRDRGCSRCRARSGRCRARRPARGPRTSGRSSPGGRSPPASCRTSR